MEPEDIPTVDDEVVEYDTVPGEEDYSVVCLSCRTVQDPKRVMGSIWYKSGQMPPCTACGGVCKEIPTAAYPQFLKDSAAGKRFF